MQPNVSWRLKALHRRLLETPGAARFRSVLLLYVQSCSTHGKRRPSVVLEVRLCWANAPSPQVAPGNCCCEEPDPQLWLTEELEAQQSLMKVIQCAACADSSSLLRLHAEVRFSLLGCAALPEKAAMQMCNVLFSREERATVGSQTPLLCLFLCRCFRCDGHSTS